MLTTLPFSRLLIQYETVISWWAVSRIWTACLATAHTVRDCY